MSIEFHDPRAEPLAIPEPYQPRATFDQPLVIGLLANGFPDSETFLEALEAALSAKLSKATFRHYNKRNASIPVKPDMLAEIKRECDAAIAAYGH